MKMTRYIWTTLLLFTLALVIPLNLHADTIDVSVEIIVSECNDGIDNDGDTFIDYALDPGCESLFDNDESNTPFQCSDGIDNDGDGDIDFPDDINCSSLLDDDESAPSSGSPSQPTSIVRDDIPPLSMVTFSGIAYPHARLSVLRDGSLIDIHELDEGGTFDITLQGEREGSYIFSFIADDTEGRRSILYSIPVSIQGNLATTYSNIVVPPILSIQSQGTKNMLAVSGTAGADEDVILEITPGEHTSDAHSDSIGEYTHNINISELVGGRYSIRAYRIFEEELSRASAALPFNIGDTFFETVTRADLNGDDLVDLVDFSIAAFWYRKPLSEDMLQLEQDIMNGDGVIDLRDMSILAYYWTGS